MSATPATTARPESVRPADAPGPDRLAAARSFDGIICFGDSDWWYHNRGHYDMQMMRELSRLVPVLYVNSIGLGLPRVGEGRMFLRRIRRKLASLRRGLTRVRPGFAVLTPLVVPGRLGDWTRRPLLAFQVARAARRLGFRRPLVWVACLPGAEVVDRLAPVGVVYQRTDAYEEWSGCDRARIGQLDLALRRRADVTLFCSTYLFERDGPSCQRAQFVDHGVDFARFAAAGDDQGHEPADVRSLPRPRVGFVGSIDRHTFDAELFLETARRLPGVQFVLVGASTLPDGWCARPNVRWLGQRPYEQVADYMAACDVLIMPWNRNNWIQACNPVKLKEYLAVGRPVVSTPFAELRRYDGIVTVAKDAAEFAAAIQHVCAAPDDQAVRRERVRVETWSAKAHAVLRALEHRGLMPAAAPPGDGDAGRVTAATPGLV